MFHSSPTTFAIIGLAWIAFLGLIYPVARNRGRDPARWMVIGFFLSPVVALVSLLVIARETEL